MGIIANTTDTSFDKKAYPPVIFAISVAIILVSAALLFLSFNRPCSSDEWETIAASSFIFNGQVPYRDFYQIHTPLAYYFFIPLFLIFKTAKIFYAASLVSYTLLLLNGYLLFLISSRFFSRKTALFTLLAYLVCLQAFINMIEIRPDILVVIFSNLSLICLLRKETRAGKYFFLSGVFTALAFLSKQSGIIFACGVIILFILRFLMPARVPQEESVFSKKRFSALNLCYFVFGFLIPLIIFIFLLAQASALKPFLRYSINNDFLKTIFFMKTESSSHFSFKFINIIFSVDFIILGALIILPFWLLRNKRQGEKFIIFFVLFIVSVLGLFSALHRWRQDFLLLSQYLILLVSPLLFFHYERICSLISKRRGEVYGVFCSFLLLAFFCLPALSYIYHASKSHGISFWVNKFDTILSLTNKDDKCISVEYACPFRLSSYFYRLCPTPFESSLLTSYTEKSLMNDILHHDIVVIMPLRDSYKNYMRDLNRLIREHYILYRNSFLVPGNNFTVNDDSAIVFNVLVAGYYRVGPDGAGMSIDSKLIKTCSVYLSKGEHLVSVPDKCKKYQLVYDFEANKK